MSEIYLNNAFALRECLYIALEVCNGDLSADVTARIRQFADKLKFGTESRPVVLSNLEQPDLLEIIYKFRRSRTSRWIRDDFHDALNELEIKMSRTA